MIGEQLANGRVTLFAGDCLDALAIMAENSVDSVVTDPPYHLTEINPSQQSFTSQMANGRIKEQKTARGFMGKSWDGGDIAFKSETWAAVLRVLKPGGFCLAFGGTRSYHRMACAVDDAGFEIRDAIMWHYGQGFPKSRDVAKSLDGIFGKYKRYGFLRSDHPEYEPYTPVTDAASQWSGWGTALKPATEIIVVARKPLSESTVAANVLRWSVGGLNIDGCRVPCDKRPLLIGHNGTEVNTLYQGGFGGSHSGGITALGRWPANCVHDGSESVVAAFPDAKSAGEYTKSLNDPESYKNWLGNKIGPNKRTNNFANENGSAARFFYTAKADDFDRIGSRHPTIKPIDLMQWLVRLVTPRGGTVLDCFAGSGTTGEAAYREGMSAVLIEREAEYCEDIRRRMQLVFAGPDERARESIKARGKTNMDPGPLFGGG